MKKLLFIELIIIFLLSGCIQKTTEKCSLSLCDCKCYSKGETPEEKTGRICGINCLAEYGINGCELKNNQCVEIHSEKTCQTDWDCLKENSKCADGVDPYNFCDNGVCGTRTFVRDPCLDHICPKGEWIISNQTSCFTFANCAATGCDDNSGKTKDECIGIGTRSEGCLYTISNSCSKNSDCVPAQCCHPSSCVNINNAPNCSDTFCTEVCQEETMFCDGLKCICSNGQCQGIMITADSEKYCESDSDCAIQSDNCCGKDAINKKYYKFVQKICLQECPEYNYTTGCKDNICVLYPLKQN